MKLTDKDILDFLTGQWTVICAQDSVYLEANMVGSFRVRTNQGTTDTTDLQEAKEAYLKELRKLIPSYKIAVEFD
jgi:hypothetical protein